jgi:hypothetical protein
MIQEHSGIAVLIIIILAVLGFELRHLLGRCSTTGGSPDAWQRLGLVAASFSHLQG